MAARGQWPASRGLPDSKSLSFASPKESNQRKGDPGESLISCGARVRRASHKSPDGALTARGGLMVRRLDRLPLRSSERIHGDPVEQILDRFAMGFMGTRMRASGLRRHI
jgi:hypothetical protein